MSEKVTAMIEEIKGLTVLELSELVHALEEEFGVSAAGAVLRHLIGRAAVMTHKFFLSFMENRKPRAVPAAAHPAAGRAG
mgnify:CR=1 FL=1